MKEKKRSVDLGQAQGEFEQANREWQAAERALARAQEIRDRAKGRATAADLALRDAARLVLG